MQEISGSANTETGSYKDLKYAHLEHDDDKFNSNKEIDYEKTKFNQHHYYLNENGYEDEDEFINQNYDEPIREIDEKHKARRQYKRMLGSYEEYAKKKENDSRRKDSNKPYGRDRLLTRKYGTQEDKEQIYNQFLKQGVSIEEITKAINSGFHESTKAFNERYKGQLIITESFTHVDEGADHTHDHLYAIGTDRYGKPRTDVNQSLHEVYGGKKHKYNGKGEMIRDKNGKPKEFKKSNRDVWRQFRNEMDKSTVEHVNAKLIDLAKDKKIQFNAPKFVRKNVNETDYEEHDIYKQNAQRKDKLIDDLVLRFPDKRIKTGKDKVTEPIKDEGTQAILKRGDMDSLMNLYKMLEASRKEEEEKKEKKEKKLKEREQRLKEQQEEQDKREDELRVREDGLIEKEQGLNERENVVKHIELGLERKEEEFDERLREKEESFNKMYERPTYYAFCEDIKNRYVKAKKKKHPDINVEGILYDKFKLDSYLVGSAEDIKIKRARKDLSVENETTVNQPKVKKEKEGFDPRDDD